MSKQTPTLPGAKQIGKRGPGSYTDRTSVRAVISNARNEILLLPISLGSYYTLPGSSIQANESHHLAAVREVEDQTGCRVTIAGPVIAHAEEWREEEGLHQISYCYVGKLVAEADAAEEKVVGGKKYDWVGVEAAIGLMKSCRPRSVVGEYVCQRDLYFVEAYAMELQGRAA